MMSSLVLISWLLLGLLRLPCTVKGHGAVVSLNNEGDATGSRNWRTHRGLVPGLSEWDPNSLLGTGGRVDEFDSACGEPGQTQHSEQYRGVQPPPIHVVMFSACIPITVNICACPAAFYHLPFHNRSAV